MDRLRKEGAELGYRCPRRDEITLTPLELIDRIATHVLSGIQKPVTC